MNAGVPLGRLFGAEIRAHWTWIFVLALVTVYFGGGPLGPDRPASTPVFGWGAAIVCAVLVFGSVTAHELAHVWVARRNGIGGSVVVVQLLGGTYLMETRPRTPGQELRSALAGPLVSLVAMAGFLGLVAATEIGWGAARRLEAGLRTDTHGVIAVSFVGQVLALFNLFLAGTNLLPAYPMDGARWSTPSPGRGPVAKIGRWPCPAELAGSSGSLIMVLGAALIPIASTSGLA